MFSSNRATAASKELQSTALIDSIMGAAAGEALSISFRAASSASPTTSSLAGVSGSGTASVVTLIVVPSVTLAAARVYSPLSLAATSDSAPSEVTALTEATCWPSSGETVNLKSWVVSTLAVLSAVSAVTFFSPSWL